MCAVDFPDHTHRDTRVIPEIQTNGKVKFENNRKTFHSHSGKQQQL